MRIDFIRSSRVFSHSRVAGDSSLIDRIFEVQFFNRKQKQGRSSFSAVSLSRNGLDVCFFHLVKDMKLKLADLHFTLAL